MFNFNAVFQKKPKTPEITPEELDTITVMTGPELSEEQVLRMLQDGVEVDFILTRHNIYLTKHSTALFDALHIKEEDCLIPNGVMQYEAPLKTLNFGYFLNGDPINETRRMSQKKITDFLEKRGIKVEKIGSLNPKESSNEANRKIAIDWLAARMSKFQYLMMGVETRGDEAVITYERREHDKAPVTIVRELLKIKDGKIIESQVLPF